MELPIKSLYSGVNWLAPSLMRGNMLQSEGTSKQMFQMSWHTAILIVLCKSQKLVTFLLKRRENYMLENHVEFTEIQLFKVTENFYCTIYTNIW